jgi:hypothetical protein
MKYEHQMERLIMGSAETIVAYYNMLLVWVEVSAQLHTPGKYPCDHESGRCESPRNGLDIMDNTNISLSLSTVMVKNTGLCLHSAIHLHSV